MSAVLLLAFALVSYLGFSSVAEWARNERWQVLAKGLAQSTLLFLWTLLGASLIVWVFNNSMNVEVAAEKLSMIEADLRAVQRWRSWILGSWDWRLVLAIVGVGVAGTLFAAEELTSRAQAVLRYTKTAGKVLALLAGLTISTLPADEVLRDMELRYAEATQAMASDAQAIEAAIARQVRASVLDAALSATAFCSAPERPECRRFDGLHDVPSHALLGDDPMLIGVWEGTYAVDGAERRYEVAPVPRFDSVRTALDGMTPAALSSVRQTVTGNFPVLGWRNWMDASGRKALLSVAVDAGYDSAIEAAQSAGASGDLVQALLLPLVASPIKALFERLSEDAVLLALQDKSPSELAAAIETGAEALVTNGVSVAERERAAEAAADILRAAEIRSGQALIDARETAAREAADRARASGGTTTLGGGFTGIQASPGVIDAGPGPTNNGVPTGVPGEPVTGRGVVVR